MKRGVEVFKIVVLVLLMLGLVHAIGGLGLGLASLLQKEEEEAKDCPVPTKEYKTIQDAIKDTSCARIYVYSGEYEPEKLFIGRSLTLHSVHPGESIIKGDGEHEAILITANNVNIKGFQIREGQYGVCVKGSTGVNLERNTISGNEESGIEVSDGAHNVTIKRNKIEGNEIEAGISVMDSSQATIIDNEKIEGNLVGIWVGAGSQATIENNEIKNNATFGIQVSDAQSVTIKDNEIKDNVSSGVSIIKKIPEEVTVNDNVIIKNGELKNGECGINVVEDTKLKVKGKGNRIWGHQIRFCESKAEIQEIPENIKDLADPEIKVPEDFDKIQSAINEADKEKNKIFTDPITISVSPDHTYIENLHIKLGYLFGVHDSEIENKLNGGIIPEELKEAFEANEFHLSENATITKSEDVWVITDDGKSFIIKKEGKRLNIYLQTIDSLKLVGEGQPVIEAQSVQSLAISIESSFYPTEFTIKGFDIQNGSAGIKVAGIPVPEEDFAVSATIENSDIKDNDVGIEIIGNVHATIDKTDVLDNQSFGIFFQSQYKAIPSDQIINSKIKNNGGAGLSLEGQSKVDIKETTIQDNRGDGIVLKNSPYVDRTPLKKLPHVTIQASTIQSNRGGIVIRDHAFAEVKDGVSINQNKGGNGIEIHDSGRATITGGNIQINDNERNGIEIRDSGRVTLTRISIISNKQNGILLRDEASLDIEKSQIKNNGKWGVAVYLWDCFKYDPDASFEAEALVTGCGNEIWNNDKGDVCPDSLEDLKESCRGIG